MDQVYIDALITQALGVYKAGGQENLDRWLNALPAPHRTEFETCCKERLQEAIEVMLHPEPRLVFIEGLDEDEPPTKGPPATDPRKRHRRDRRRTKPL